MGRMRVQQGEVGIGRQRRAIGHDGCSSGSGTGSRHVPGLRGPRRRGGREGLERKPVAHVEACARKSGGCSRGQRVQERSVDVRLLLLRLRRQCCSVSSSLQMSSRRRSAGRKIHELREFPFLLLHGQIVHEVVLVQRGLECVAVAPSAQLVLRHVRDELGDELRRALLLLLQHEGALAPDGRVLLAHLAHALVHTCACHHHSVLQSLDGAVGFVHVAAIKSVLLAQRRHLQQQQQTHSGHDNEHNQHEKPQQMSRANVQALVLLS